MPPGTCGLRHAALLLCPGRQDRGGKGLAVSTILVGFTELLCFLLSSQEEGRWSPVLSPGAMDSAIHLTTLGRAFSPASSPSQHLGPREWE